MPITILSGQRLTPARLNAPMTAYYPLDATPSLTSQATLQDTVLVVPIVSISEVELSVRYTANGGGIRWAWRSTGTVTGLSRDIGSAGSAASTTDASHNIGEMRWRQIATLDEEQVSAQYSTTTTQLIRERLIVDGAGTLVFRFAQASSNASATSLHAASFATVRRMRRP
ncbi:hypothetical protein [Micromonospora sp. DT229]|uniref:hypothetical protein n=1 Tax=Micromonospora sp. DT229 TaxID=3393430 RepID=UPI003CEAD8CA